MDVGSAVLCLTLAFVVASLSPVLLAATLPVWLLCLRVSGAATASVTADPAGAACRVLRAAGVLGLVVWLASAVVTMPGPSWQPQALVASLAVASVGVRWTTGLAARSTPRSRTLAVGPRDLVARTLPLLRERAGQRGGGLDVVAVCLDELDTAAFDVPVAVGLDDVDAIADEALAMDVQTVLVHPCAALGPHALRRLAWRLEESGTTLLVTTGLLDVASSRADASQVGDLVVVGVRPPRRGIARGLVGIAERLAAAGLLALFVPLLVGLAVSIRRDSPGPAFFRQQRVGRDGRLFTMIKFRTMTDGRPANDELADVNEADGVLFKVRQDPRVTVLGRVLRRYSLDELPQLINVVRGEMSLVGPRPALPEEVAQYDVDAQRRLHVKPGLTGLWQVSGRSDLSWEDSVRLDVHYVDNWSPQLDARILWRTVGAVVGHRGAY